VAGTDTDTATGKDAAFTYTSPGVYTARVTVSDGHGGTDTTTTRITVERAADTTAPRITGETPAPRLEHRESPG